MVKSVKARSIILNFYFILVLRVQGFGGGRGGPILWTIFLKPPYLAQMVKNLPAMQETGVQSLGGEDPLEKGMAIHASILAWRFPRTEKPGGLQFMGSQTVGHN